MESGTLGIPGKDSTRTNCAATKATRLNRYFGPRSRDSFIP
jgi:hypothetical protein